MITIFYNLKVWYKLKRFYKLKLQYKIKFVELKTFFFQYKFLQTFLQDKTNIYRWIIKKDVYDKNFIRF